MRTHQILPTPHAAEATGRVDGALSASRVPRVAAPAPSLPVVVKPCALALGVDAPHAAVHDLPVFYAESVTPIPIAACRELNSPPAGELIVVGDGGGGIGAHEVERVGLGAVVGDEIWDVDRPALEVGDVEELGDEADGGLHDSYVHAEMLNGVLDTDGVAIEGIVTVWGDRGMILVVRRITGEGEMNVIVGDEEGGIAEIIEGVWAYERHDMLTFIL